MRDPGFGEAMIAIFRHRRLPHRHASQAETRRRNRRWREACRLSVSGRCDSCRRHAETCFNASPCFAAVSNQFFAASTIELGREMIGVLKNSPPSGAKPNSLTAQSRASLCGRRQFTAKIFEDQQLTQTVLERAVSVDDARKEVEAGIEFLRGLGVLSSKPISVRTSSASTFGGKRRNNLLSRRVHAAVDLRRVDAAAKRR